MITIQGKISIPVVKNDQLFELLVPNGVAYGLAYDAVIDMLKFLCSKIEEEKLAQIKKYESVNKEESLDSK